MENYKSRLLSQKEALQTDIDKMVVEIDLKEIEIDEMKQRKSLAQRELRGYSMIFNL